MACRSQEPILANNDGPGTYTLTYTPRALLTVFVNGIQLDRGLICFDAVPLECRICFLDKTVDEVT